MAGLLYSVPVQRLSGPGVYTTMRLRRRVTPSLHQSAAPASMTAVAIALPIPDAAPSLPRSVSEAPRPIRTAAAPRWYPQDRPDPWSVGDLPYRSSSLGGVVAAVTCAGDARPRRPSQPSAVTCAPPCGTRVAVAAMASLDERRRPATFSAASVAAALRLWGGEQHACVNRYMTVRDGSEHHWRFGSYADLPARHPRCRCRRATGHWSGRTQTAHSFREEHGFMELRDWQKIVILDTALRPEPAAA